MRTISVWAFTAFFAGISLLGPGWHCAFGHHFHGPTACDHDEHACSHGHAHESASAASPVPGPAAAHPAGSASQGGFVATAELDAHDCPLCKFFGHAQWAPASVAAELVQLASRQAISAESVSRLGCLGLYRSRAPPVG